MTEERIVSNEVFELLAKIKVWHSLSSVGEAPIFRERERTEVRDRARTN